LNIINCGRGKGKKKKKLGIMLKADWGWLLRRILSGQLEDWILLFGILSA
jgi:hypothetical protein